MPHFSRKQQQILGILGLTYGICLLLFLVQNTSGSLVVHDLQQADPPDLFSYLDPPIDVNLADSLELQLLPGIGPVLAQRIIDYRHIHGPFRSVEELDKIYGIGPKTVQKVRHYLVFSE